MKEAIVRGRTLPEAYHDALILLQREGEIVDCADWNTTQKELSMTMIVDEPLAEPRISRLFIGGPKELEQYRQEMLDGILDFEVKNGNWDYTYHDRMTHYPAFSTVYDDKNEFTLYHHIDQIDFVINELKRNPSSRRAVVVIRDVGADTKSSDAACMQNIQYFIRDNKLECKVLFRSNDACKASFMNAFALICLQERIASALGVEVGKYVHRANSFHCYEQDFGMLEGYCKRIEEAEDDDDICFEYEWDWKEDMEFYQPEIAKQVQVLKERANV